MALEGAGTRSTRSIDASFKRRRIGVDSERLDVLVSQLSNDDKRDESLSEIVDLYEVFEPLGHDNINRQLSRAGIASHVTPWYHRAGVGARISLSRILWYLDPETLLNCTTKELLAALVASMEDAVSDLSVACAYALIRIGYIDTAAAVKVVRRFSRALVEAHFDLCLRGEPGAEKALSLMLQYRKIRPFVDNCPQIVNQETDSQPISPRRVRAAVGAEADDQSANLSDSTDAHGLSSANVPAEDGRPLFQKVLESGAVESKMLFGLVLEKLLPEPGIKNIPCIVADLIETICPLVRVILENGIWETKMVLTSVLAKIIPGIGSHSVFIGDLIGITPLLFGLATGVYLNDQNQDEFGMPKLTASFATSTLTAMCKTPRADLCTSTIRTGKDILCNEIPGCKAAAAHFFQELLTEEPEEPEEAARFSEVQAQVIGIGVTPILVHLLRNGSPEEQISAIGALRNIAVTHSQDLIARGVVPLIVKLMRDTPVQVRLEKEHVFASSAVGALRNLWERFDEVAMAVAGGVVPALLEQVRYCQKMQRELDRYDGRRFNTDEEDAFDALAEIADEDCAALDMVLHGAYCLDFQRPSFADQLTSIQASCEYAIWTDTLFEGLLLAVRTADHDPVRKSMPLRLNLAIALSWSNWRTLNRDVIWRLKASRTLSELLRALCDPEETSGSNGREQAAQALAELMSRIGPVELPQFPAAHISVDPLLAEMCNNPKFSDVNLKAKDGKSFFVHKIIVCTRCKYLDLLLSGSMMEAHMHEVALDVPAAILEAVLLHLYKGNVSIQSMDFGLELFIAADMMSIPSLQRECEIFIASNADLGRLQEIHQVAQQANAITMQRWCMMYALRSLPDGKAIQFMLGKYDVLPSVDINHPVHEFWPVP